MGVGASVREPNSLRRNRSLGLSTKEGSERREWVRDARKLAATRGQSLHRFWQESADSLVTGILAPELV
jgi:hypothetical protein